tara:strand:+ start:393 stop:1298 length:906 start_codon:yes stop_codon:yes gene_type:complete
MGVLLVSIGGFINEVEANDTQTVKFLSCEESDGVPGYKQHVTSESREKFIIQVGFETGLSFTPAEIQMNFKEKDDDVTINATSSSNAPLCSSQLNSITSYHAHNGDDTNYEAGEEEYNLSYGKGYSSFKMVSNRFADSGDHMDWVLYETIFQLDDTYQININTAAEPGTDPFNGKIQNDPDYILNKLEIGTMENHCRRIFLSNFDSMDGTFSWTGYNNQDCIIKTALSTGTYLYGVLNFQNIEYTFDDEYNMTFKDYPKGLFVPLYRSIKDNNTIVAYLNFNFESGISYSFYDAEQNLITK